MKKNIKMNKRMKNSKMKPKMKLTGLNKLKLVSNNKNLSFVAIDHCCKL